MGSHYGQRPPRDCCKHLYRRRGRPHETDATTSTEAEGENHIFPWLPTDPYDDFLRPVDWQELFSGIHDDENDDGSSYQ